MKNFIIKKMIILSFCVTIPETVLAQPNNAASKEPALVVVMTRMPPASKTFPAPTPSKLSLEKSPILNADHRYSSDPPLQINGDVTNILRHVYQTNPTLLATRAEIQAIHEKYPQALSGYRPTMNMEATIYNQDVNSKNIGPYDGTTTKDMVLNITQPIYRGGRTVAEIDKAHSVIKAGFAGLRQGEQFIFLQTITAICDMVRDRALLELRENNVALLTEELKAAKARMEAGELTMTDAKQAEARLSRAISEKIFTETTLNSSSADFEQLLGGAPPENLKFPDLIFTFPATQQDMLTWANKNNPEIQVAEYTNSVANHNIDLVFRELFPQVSAFATFSEEYDPQPGNVNDVGASTIGLRASFPLYDAGLTRSRVREAKNTARQRAFQVEETRRRIHQRILADSSNLKAAEAEIVFRVSEIEAAKLAREGVGAEAHLGGRTVLDVLDADQELLDAKAARIIADRNQIVNHYSLAADLGILTPENLGLNNIVYDPGPHYRAMGKRFFSMNPDVTGDDEAENPPK